MKKILLTTLPVLALGVMSTQAAVVSVADSLNQTGDTTLVRNIADVSSEDSIYVTGTFTFDTVDLTLANAIVEVQIAGTVNAYRIGHRNNTDNFDVIKPSTGVLDASIGSGDSHTVALLMNTVTGAYSVWLNPNFALTEASVAADITGLDATTGIGTLEQLQFRTLGGDVADFTDFAVYTGADTPFAPVPEPSSAALLGLGGLALILRRRK